MWLQCTSKFLKIYTNQADNVWKYLVVVTAVVVLRVLKILLQILQLFKNLFLWCPSLSPTCLQRFSGCQLKPPLNFLHQKKKRNAQMGLDPVVLFLLVSALPLLHF